MKHGHLARNSQLVAGNLHVMSCDHPQHRVMHAVTWRQLLHAVASTAGY
jgi:hypothetical protein